MNPRNGDTDAIKESVLLNGIYRPIICAEDLTILAGHHLYHALGELGIESVDVVRLPVPSSSEDAARIMLADNRIADRGNYDEGMLLSLLIELDAGDGLTGTGYDDDDLLALITLLGKIADAPVAVEDTPTIAKEPCPVCGKPM